MSTELVKVDYAVYGLEENRATEIARAFSEPFRELGELEVEFDQFRDFVGEYTEDICATAKELNKKYVKIRTRTAAIHKSEKAVFLSAGRYVDALKNGQLAIGKEREDKLTEVSDYFVNLEKEHIEAISAERHGQLLAFMDAEFIPSGLGDMQDDVFESYLAGVEKKYNDRIAEEAKAEQDRIAEEEEEKAEQERIREENEVLRIKTEKLEKQKVAAAKKAQKFQDQKEAELAEERAQHEAVIAKERADKEELIAKERTRIDNERKAEENRIALEKKAEFELAEQKRKAAAAPDKEKLQSYINMIYAVPEPVLATEEANNLFNKAKCYIDDFTGQLSKDIKAL